MRAEHGVCGVIGVPLRLIAYRVDNLLLVAARAVAARRQAEPAPAVGIGQQLLHIFVHPCDGRRALKAHHAARVLWGVDLPVHHAHVAYRPAYLLRRDFEHEAVPRFEQDAFCLHQPLTHSAVGRLTEVPALCVLYVRAPRGEREAYIRHRRAGQNADVLLLGKVREDEPLPVAFKLVLRAAA